MHARDTGVGLWNWPCPLTERAVSSSGLLPQTRASEAPGRSGSRHPRPGRGSSSRAPHAGRGAASLRPRVPIPEKVLAPLPVPLLSSAHRLGTGAARCFIPAPGEALLRVGLSAPVSPPAPPGVGPHVQTAAIGAFCSEKLPGEPARGRRRASRKLPCVSGEAPGLRGALQTAPRNPQDLPPH